MFEIRYNDRRFQHALRRYKAESRKDWPEIVEKQADKARFRIYLGFRSLIPSVGKIQSDADRSLAAGKGLKRGRGKTVKEEIARRKGKPPRGFLAASWLTRIWARRGGGRRVLLAVKGRGSTGRIGEVDIDTAGAAPSVTITSFLPGVAAQEKKHQFIPKALNWVANDMLVYVHRRMKQRAQRFSRG